MTIQQFTSVSDHANSVAGHCRAMSRQPGLVIGGGSHVSHVTNMCKQRDLFCDASPIIDRLWSPTTTTTLEPSRISGAVVPSRISGAVVPSRISGEVRGADYAKPDRWGGFTEPDCRGGVPLIFFPQTKPDFRGGCTKPDRRGGQRREHCQARLLGRPY